MEQKKQTTALCATNSMLQVMSQDRWKHMSWETINTPRFWFEDQPIVTHFFNAISLSVPGSEHFLVQILRQFQPQLQSQPLKQKVHDFIHEENTHSLHHTKFNRDLIRYHYPVDFFTRFIRFGYRTINKLFSQKSKLAMTVCLEHMTAVIAAYVLRNGIMKPGVKDIYDLCIWHANEELDHRALTHDVYAAVRGGYIRRVLSMLYITWLFFFAVLVIQSTLIYSDLRHRNGIKLKHWWFASTFFFGRKGMLWGCLKHYVAIYRFNYIP